MERIIKFRGKRVDNGEWVEGSLFIDCDKSIFIIPTGMGIFAGQKVIHETVGQFTGLTDKNGKEIYEGDVVIHLEATEPEEKGFLCMFKDFRIKFMNVNFLEDDFYSTVNYEYVKNNTEIIGNIHDNAELLK